MLYDWARSAILPLDIIDNNISKKADVVELGCGQGVISRYLAVKGQRKIIAVDLDASRFPKSKIKNVTFVKSDIRSYKINNPDVVIISDVLHHLKKDDQADLLVRLSRNLKKNSKLIIKEIDASEFISAKLSRLWDFLLYPKDEINYFNASDLRKKLELLGFSVELKRTNRLFPGSTALLICTKS